MRIVVQVLPPAATRSGARASRSPAERPRRDIIVTALKRPEPLSTLPATARVLKGDRLSSASGISGTGDLARELPSLSISSLGPGRNRLFLRGIGDGPLNGFNQGSVAILLDEARLNYDAPDPDWALVDVHQVEVLEGPQGPLYGTGALGGIVKISTNRPDLSHFKGALKSGLSLSEEGDLSDSGTAMLNLPLLEGKAAIRAVGYLRSEAGWIDTSGGPRDANREQLGGGRLAIRWSPADRWTLDLAGALQNRRARDSQYVDGNLGALRRPERFAEPRDLDARLLILTIEGPIGPTQFTSITSLSRQEASASYDATPLAGELGMSGPTIVVDDRNYRLFDQETRIGNAERARFNWLVGISLIDARTRASILAGGAAGKQPLLLLNRRITEAALFADASYALSSAFSLGAGARIFSTRVDDDGRAANKEKMHGRHRIRGASDLTLTWRPAPGIAIFLRGATAYRPGGANVEPDAPQPQYQADELAGLELGSRVELSHSLSFSASLFASAWQHVQADVLLGNGLVATSNVGDGRNLGLESNIRLALGKGFTLAGAFIAQSAQLDAAGSAAAIGDRRLPAVSRFAARLKLEHRFRALRWEGHASLGVRYSGATHLSFDPLVDRRTPAHASADAIVKLSRAGWTAALAGENLTGSSADTFAFGNPYRVRASPQRTPMKPRTIGLSLTREF